MIQMFNDYILSVCALSMMAFTELVPDILVRYELGWWYVGFIALQIAFNYLLFIIPVSVKYIYMLILK